MRQRNFIDLRWSSFHGNILKTFEDVRASEDFSDVTLACDDDCIVEAHKLILASGSIFFHKLFSAGRFKSTPHPIIFLNGVKAWQLEAFMDFIYSGETRVRQEDLKYFLELAQQLGISGIGECLTANQSEINLISNSLKQSDLNIFTNEQNQVFQSEDRFEIHNPGEKNLKDENSKNYLEDTSYADAMLKGVKIIPISLEPKMKGRSDGLFIQEDFDNQLPCGDFVENMKQNNEEYEYMSAPSVQLQEESICENSVSKVNSFSKPKTMSVKYQYEKKYNCNQCESKFTHNTAFLKHKQSKHEGMKYVCDECRKEFVQKAHLVRHKKKRHL